MALKHLPSTETMLERLSTTGSAVAAAAASAATSAAAGTAAAAPSVVASAAVSTLMGIGMGGAALRAPSDRKRTPSAKAAVNRPSPTAASSPIKPEVARVRVLRERERERDKK